jgi:hypothetical protein
MLTQAKWLVAIGLGIGLVGCSSDRPHDYGRERPPVDSLTEGDVGLQSKDVVNASDTMARDLLADPELRASEFKWTMVVDRMEDRTIDHSFQPNFDIFLERLKVNLSKYGRGGVRLVDNRAKTNQLRSREWDGARDDFGQGSPGSAAASRTQPQYALYGKALDMPNRRTNYYMLEFTVTDMRSGEIVWTNAYEVKTAR